MSAARWPVVAAITATGMTGPRHVAFALDDARAARVEVESSGGEARSGYETDWTFAVPSRSKPRYFIVAIKNDLIATPASRREDLETFRIVVSHPERFDTVWVARGRHARPLMTQVDQCFADQIEIGDY